MFVAARSIEFNTNYYDSSSASDYKACLEFELSNSRQVSANYVKLADIKEKHTNHCLYGSSLTSVGVYLIYTESDVLRVFPGDCGSKLVNGELVERLPAITGSKLEKHYEFEDMGYLECHLSKERSLEKILVVARGDDQELVEYAHEKARIISTMISGVKVEVL
jgi:hypothetical protein